MSDEDVSIDLFLKGEDQAVVRAMVEGAGAKSISQLKEKAMTGIELVLLATIAIQALANVVIRLAPLAKSGIVVDARGQKVRIRKDKSLPNGHVVIISKTGVKVTMHEPSEVKFLNIWHGKPAG